MRKMSIKVSKEIMDVLKNDKLKSPFQTMPKDMAVPVYSDNKPLIAWVTEMFEANN